MSMKKNDKPEKELPFEKIIDFLTALIETLNQRILVRKVIASVCCLIGSGFIYWTISYIGPKQQGMGVALIAVGGIFYGTIAFGVLQNVLDKGDKRASASKIKTELQKISEADNQTRNKKFEEKFYDLLKTLF